MSPFELPCRQSGPVRAGRFRRWLQLWCSDCCGEKGDIAVILRSVLTLAARLFTVQAIVKSRSWAQFLDGSCNHHHEQLSFGCQRSFLLFW